MLNHQEIKAFNPQRYPIALVDRMVEIKPGESAIGLKAVTGTEACYSHLDETADIEEFSYPRSLLTESFCQASGPLCSQSGLDFNERVMLFISMKDAEFIEPVYPGDVMEHNVLLEKMTTDAVVLSGVTKVNGRLVARFGQLIVAAKEKLPE